MSIPVDNPIASSIKTRSSVTILPLAPGANGQPHERFWGGHFVQEDRGEYLAEQITNWIRMR